MKNSPWNNLNEYIHMNNLMVCTDLFKEHCFCTGAVFADIMYAMVFPNYFRFFLKDYQNTTN